MKTLKIYILFIYLITSIFFFGCNDNENEPMSSNGYAPTIESVSAVDLNLKEIVSSNELNFSKERLVVNVKTSERFGLQFNVETKDASANMTVASGSDWIVRDNVNNKSEQGQYFRVILKRNEMPGTRVGVLVFYNEKNPKMKTEVSIIQRGTSSATEEEYAPIITSVIALDPMTEAPTDNINHLSKDPFININITTPSTYKILLEVVSNKSPTEGKVLSGSDWLSLSEVKKESIRNVQYFKLVVMSNISDSQRSGSIALYNTKNKGQQLIIGIHQIGHKAKQDPENIKDRLALNYVSEWNIDKSKKFIKTYNNKKNQVGLVSFQAALNLFNSNVFIDGEEYILPSALQWMSIVPSDGVYSRSEKRITDQEETCMVGGRIIESLNDYLNIKDEFTTYAIRFKGDEEQQSAWRYVYKENPEGGKILVVEERHMPEGTNWTLDDISNKAFWNKDRDQTVQRFFPTPGYALGNFYTKEPSDKIELEGECGFCWTSTSAGYEQAWAMEVLKPQVRVRDFYAKIDGHNIRPFRKTLMK